MIFYGFSMTCHRKISLEICNVNFCEKVTLKLVTENLERPKFKESF
jgi:hypothetical protein